MSENPSADGLVEAWNEGDSESRAELAKSTTSGSITKMEFEVSTEGSIDAIEKADGDYIIWGPASVEMVDKERDRIKADALKEALPQLLKRARLSYEHQDQIVGDILKQFTTEEPKSLMINGHTFERSEFPTDVLKVDGMNPALFVAGNIYNDTQKAQEVRKQIDNGEIDSYSISGEAVVTEMAVKDGQTFTDILKMDLSAVTLCREGMNQKSKFDVVDKATGSGLTVQQATSIAKSKLSKTMANNNTEDEDDDVQKFVDKLDETLDKQLPDGEIATMEAVEKTVEEKFEEKAQEGSPSEGTADRPSGDGDGGTQTDPDFEGDTDEWGDDPSDDSDKVEEKSGAYTTEELKSILPDDQFKAIEPLLEGEEEEQIDPMEDKPPEAVEPSPEPAPEPEPEPEPEQQMADEPMPPEEEKTMAHQAARSMHSDDDEEDEEEDRRKSVDWDRLTDAQKKAFAKTGGLEKAESGVRANASDASGPQQSQSPQDADEVAKTDGESIGSDPALRKIYDDNGEVKL